ncbi:MAG: xanthine dehydrogenase family protein molybdopterin-binding subunit [Nitrospinota bacterium]|nr:MAG: xanthine dehydrogenase family protein molybdopterin-binding subunit [Nitrospinota bacterium]
MASHTAVGQRVTRIDAADRVTGRARYADDFRLPGMLYGKLLLSPLPHARIRRIDTSRAERLAGVKAVITAQDAPEHRFGGLIKDRLIFAREKVRYAGEPIAAVAAVDEATAEEAIHLIAVEYEELPVILDPQKAAAPDALLVHEEWETYLADPDLPRRGNICNGGEVRFGDVEQGFREADLIVEERYETQMAHQAYIEPHAAMAAVDPSGKITVWSTTQGQFPLRDALAEIFALPHTRIKVIGTEIGGGFGGKIAPTIEPVCILLSQKTGRPVKITMDREEDFLDTTPRRPCIVELKTGVKRDGTLLAREARIYFATGAYAIGRYNFAGNVCRRLSGPYYIPNVHFSGYSVYTNQQPCGAFRAPGSPQVTFACESHMESIAAHLGMDPIQLRKKNALRKGQQTAIGSLDDSADLVALIDRAVEESGWYSKPLAPNQGRGIACSFWTSSAQAGSNTVKLNQDGTVAVTTGSIDLTGTHTTLAQIVSEEVGVDLQQVSVTTADTDVAPVAPVSAGSNITRSMGASVKLAAETLRQKLLELAADHLEANVHDLEIRKGEVYVKGVPERGVSFKTLYNLAATSRGGPPVVTASTTPQAPTVNFTIQVATVEVDPETGAVKVLDLVVVQDVGFAINPLSVQGQMEGGATQGLGYGLMEQMIFLNGKLSNPHLLDYKIPSALDVPPIKTVMVEEPASRSPYGAKGVGEPPIVATAAALANAIYQATGVRISSLPLTPEKILQALQARKE